MKMIPGGSAGRSRLCRQGLLVLFLVVVLAASASGGQRWSRTSPRINLTHIFEGEINSRWKPTGFHSRPGGRDPAGARVKKILSPPNRAGVYTARVVIRDRRTGRWLEKFSTLFPDALDREQVIKAILHGWRHRKPGRKQPWQGPSGLGFPIRGYVNHRGDINTAFPIYVKD